MICCGPARGGTTALAYALVRAGVDLGADLPLNLEDGRFVACIGPERIDQPRLRSLLAEDRGARWGFKAPEALFHLQWFEQNAHKPVFVIVLRSPLAVANSVLRHDKNYERNKNGFVDAFTHPVICYSEILNALSSLQSPAILIDYESLLYNSEKALEELFSWLQIDSDAISEISREISSSGYKKIN